MAKFKKVDPRQSLPKLEEEISKFWKQNKIFEKSVEKNCPDKSFIFYEGPPTANGTPGLHHVLARAFKDIIPRYKTMKGYRVERKAGWDTHGLPVELQVEKELGLRSKQDIENIMPGDVRASIIEFNKKCKESVWKYKDLWERMTTRMAFWVDMEHPYVTYENKYIESVWWVIAQIFKTKNAKDESLIYKGEKVVHYCYRCGTPLSSHEVAQGYQTIKDNSVYVKFKVKAGQKIGDFETDDQTYVLAWTTTPWTLPGNVALAVNTKEVLYRIADVESNSAGVFDLKSGDKIVLANYRFEPVFNGKAESASFNNSKVLQINYPGKGVITFKWSENHLLSGKDLLNLKYQPLYQTHKGEKKAYFVIDGSKFVTTEEGTGVVHIAPAFGEDDMQVSKDNDLPTVVTVDEEGKIVKGLGIPGEGIAVKKKNQENKYAVDELIIEDLRKRGLLFGEEIYKHEYPFCWRCDTPLIYYSKPSWFIRMSELRKELVENNREINWVPAHFKAGRFGEWLEGAKDWAISRERYWGTPLPIWECHEENQKSKIKNQRRGCGNVKVVESAGELEELSGKKLEDLHKPYIDEVTFGCEKCGGIMERTPEVMDVWFDSGSMPLAQFLYPHYASSEEKKKIESGKFFPADFISEAVDQTRGWFYTLHAIATLLRKAGKVPAGQAFKNVICLGHILDKHGKKMSKSRGNVIDPMEVMSEFGADALRWVLFTINQPGLPKRFDIKVMRDAANRVFRMLWNSYYFFVMYAILDKYNVSSIEYNASKNSNLLDRWIVSELNILVKAVDERLKEYDVYGAAVPVEQFVDNLSNWYIRRSRRRFWKSESDQDKKQAYTTLHYVLITLAKLMAPFTPFVSEEIYRNLVSPSPPAPLPKGEGGVLSVHLADFPVMEEKLIDEQLNNQMKAVREVVTQGLALRAERKIKVRQPLAEATVKVELDRELLDIVKDELNIKKIAYDKNIDKDVILDTKITEELKLEGLAREIIRFIQQMRKVADYEVDNRIQVCYSGAAPVFEKFGDLITKEVLAKELSAEIIESPDLKKEFDLDGEKLSISIKR